MTSGVRSACVRQKISALSNSQAVSLIHNKVRTHRTSEKILRGQTNLQILRNLCSKVGLPPPLASTIASQPTQQRNYSKSLRLYESCVYRVAIRQDGLSSRQGRPKIEKSQFPLAKCSTKAKSHSRELLDFSKSLKFFTCFSKSSCRSGSALSLCQELSFCMRKAKRFAHLGKILLAQTNLQISRKSRLKTTQASNR